MNQLLFGAVLALLLVGFPMVLASESATKSLQSRVILWFDTQEEKDAFVQERDVMITHHYENVPGLVAKVTAEELRSLQSRKHLRVYPDQEFFLLLNESRHVTNAHVVESYGYTGNNQAVCVLDTGVAYTHPMLGGCFGPGCKVVSGYDFANNDADPMDDNGHGTHVAGVVASSDVLHRGIAPNAKVVALKVCNRGGTCWASDVLAGLDWCITNKDRYNIQAATLSVGSGSYTSQNCPTYLNPVIDQAYQRGIFLAAASGNSASTQGIAYPACAPHVVSVGASYETDVGRFVWSGTSPCADQTSGPGKLACFTNRASNLDLLAPGTFITSTRGGAFFEDSGTSYAAPHVAAAALLLKQMNPSLSVAAIETILKSTGRQVYDPATQQSFLEIDLYAALQYIYTTRSYLSAKPGG